MSERRRSSIARARKPTRPSARAYLEQACGGDAALRAAVEALLRADDAAGSFLESPAAGAGRDRRCQPAGEAPRHGDRPVQAASSKSAKAAWAPSGWPSRPSRSSGWWPSSSSRPAWTRRQVIARFEAERQALALMDHPNIARCSTPARPTPGRPYFVMDLVKGVPITRYCDEHHLTPRQRLELFIPVCQAVQHAHQKGIIHRDLKPSNVLVALYDGQPVPKVIDFGVAKAAGQPLTEKTLVTGFGSDRRHAGVHVARAGRDQSARHRHAQRHLLAGRAAVRAAGRQPAVHPQGAGKGRHAGDAAGDPRAGAVEAEHEAEHGGGLADPGRQPRHGAGEADEAGARRAGLDRAGTVRLTTQFSSCVYESCRSSSVRAGSEKPDDCICYGLGQRAEKLGCKYGADRHGYRQDPDRHFWMFAFADSYDALVDAPIEFCSCSISSLPGITPPVNVAVHGENYNKRELEEGLAKIVRYETQLMGGAPYENYTFIFHIGPNSGTGGGMEHANSTAINATNVAEAIATAAHEFFHTWNVKRIRPRTLEPIDYTQEMWTRALWFAEGVTSTYASYTEVRTGMWTRQQFYGDLGQQITILQSRPARFWQSVEESSLSAWLEKYPQYNRPTISISYYNKGQLIGLLLDILIRDATDNHKSLDDVMRSLNENFAKKGLFYNDSADIVATTEAIAGQSAATFFQRYVAGTDELPFAEILSKAALGVTPAYAASVDPGFETASNFEGTQVNVVSVKPRGAADRAGIRVGDSVVSINGEAHFWLDDHQPGETIKVVISRSGQEKKISLTLGAQTVQTFRVMELQNVTDKQRRIREGMLRGTTD